LGSREGIYRKRDLSNGGGGIFLEGEETEASQDVDMDGDVFRDVGGKGSGGTLYEHTNYGGASIRFYGTDPKMKVNY